MSSPLPGSSGIIVLRKPIHGFLQGYTTAVNNDRLHPKRVRTLFERRKLEITDERKELLVGRRFTKLTVSAGSVEL